MKRILVFATLLGLVALGCEGLWRAAPETFWSNFSTNLYRIMQLFVLEGDWTSNMNPLPWEISVVRIVAPLSMIFSLIMVFMRDSWRSLTNYFVRFKKGHIIIAGLGDKGLHFAQSCVSSGFRCVFIEADKDNPLIERIISAGVPVIVGDALNENVLKKAGLSSAADLVTLAGSNGGNVEIALRVKRYICRTSRQRDRALRIHVHVTDFHLANHFEEYPRFFTDYDVAEVSFFDTSELAARQLLRDHSVDVFADAFGQKRVHIVILGFNEFSEHMVVQIARTCWFADGLPPRITIIDMGLNFDAIRLGQINEGIVNLCDISVHGLSLDENWMDQADFREVLQGVTSYIVCFQDVELGLKHALRLRRSTLQHTELNAPILLRMEKAAGLADLLESRGSEPQVPDGIFPFGMLEDVLSIENVIDKQLDQLARFVHEAYLSTVKSTESAPNTVPWERLPEVYRKENRQVGDHLAAKLRGIGCCISQSATRALEFSDAEIDILAQMEKQRWNASRSIAGWRYGPIRSDLGKIHPLLVPWERLTSEQQEIEREEARTSLPLEIGKLSVQRQFIVGICADNVADTHLNTKAIEDVQAHLN
ncbi:MAG: NAD-binding protein [Proteobacteria bacterium]|nr:NAD-binding protein [Pseudomonadota bacterium]